MESLWEGLLYSHDEIKHQGAIGRTCWSPQKMILKPPSPNVFGKKSCFFPVCWVFSVSQTERGLSESSWRMLWWANEQLGWLFAPTWCGNKQSNWGIGALALARYGYLNFPQKNTWKGYISWCRLVARFQYCLKKAPAATCVLWVELQNRPGVFSPPPPEESGSGYLVVSVGGLHSWDPIPFERDCYLGDTLRFPNHRAPYHQFTISWEKVDQRTHGA